VIPAWPLGADFVPALRRSLRDDADVQIPHHRRRRQTGRHRGLGLRACRAREGHAGSQDEKSGG
jgi:hypothetical protein